MSKLFMESAIKNAIKALQLLLNVKGAPPICFLVVLVDPESGNSATATNLNPEEVKTALTELYEEVSRNLKQEEMH